jgi:hypothetical protein
MGLPLWQRVRWLGCCKLWQTMLFNAKLALAVHVKLVSAAHGCPWGHLKLHGLGSPPAQWFVSLVCCVAFFVQEFIISSPDGRGDLCNFQNVILTGLLGVWGLPRTSMHARSTCCVVSCVDGTSDVYICAVLRRDVSDPPMSHLLAPEWGFPLLFEWSMSCVVHGNDRDAVQFTAALPSTT